MLSQLDKFFNILGLTGDFSNSSSNLCFYRFSWISIQFPKMFCIQNVQAFNQGFFNQLFNEGLCGDTCGADSCHIETSQKICIANLLVGFYMTWVSLAEEVSERILAINDTYMINTVAIVVKRFGTSSKHLLLKLCFLKLADIIHCHFNEFISFYLFLFFVNKNYFENGLWKVPIYS